LAKNKRKIALAGLRKRFEMDITVELKLVGGILWTGVTCSRI